MIYRDNDSRNWTKYPAVKALRNKILIRDKDDDPVDDAAVATKGNKEKDEA